MDAARHCYSTTQSRKETRNIKPYCKSETNVEILRKSACIRNKEKAFTESNDLYELDEKPVKEHSAVISTSEVTDKGDRDSSLDKSFDLDEFEGQVYNNISQELQTDSSYVPSLESNMKLFKTAVQEIFDNFYIGMKDFEQYKRRFEEILSKVKEDSIADMEEFIIDMIKHIRSHSSNMVTRNACTPSIRSGTSEPSERCNDSSTEAMKPTIEVCKNLNFNSDTVSGPLSSNEVLSAKRVNIYNFNCNRCEQIQLTNRSMQSEINIRDSKVKDSLEQVASAENMKVVAAKRVELERLRSQCENEHATEKDIPVKLSNPKKNISLDEDFGQDEAENIEHSILHKICRYLCRKLRKQ